MEIGDPNTGKPLGTTLLNLAASVHGEKSEQEEMYPEMASIAREEGFAEIAKWFNALGMSKRQHQKRLPEILVQLDGEEL